ATASLPRAVAGATPRPASRVAATRAASWVSEKRARPIVAPRSRATRRARSSAAPRVAPTRVTGCEGGNVRRNAAAASSRAAPDALVAAVAEAVVQAALAALPELDLVGHDAVAAPERRPGHVAAGMARLRLGEQCLERFAVGNRVALRRNARRQPAVGRARCE